MEISEDLLRDTSHIPRLLRHQLLCSLANTYVSSKEALKLEGKSVGPSIERFHGALLFVDISGFTALSSKIDVETLKNHINNYFTSMLDIVEKWGGDVIKFAGDALYIVWPTQLQQDSPISFAQLAKVGLEKALGCGLEISSVCGNYEVQLADANANPNWSLSALLPSFFGTNKVMPIGSKTLEEEVVYLNVHSGISCGLMAGVDIARAGRAEFFLIGDPLTGVAMAETEAAEGEVVLDAPSHHILHGPGAASDAKGELAQSTKTHRVSAPGDGVLPCGCRRTARGMFLPSKAVANACSDAAAPRRRSLQKGASRRDAKADKRSQLHERLAEVVRQDIDSLFAFSQGRIAQEMSLFFEEKERDAPADEVDPRLLDPRFLLGALGPEVKVHFAQWVHSHLLDCVTAHVHEVARSPGGRGVARRKLPSFHDVLLSSASHSFDCASESTKASSPFSTSAVASATTDENAVVLLAEKIKKLPQKSGLSLDLNAAEIRTVVVMFVKIDGLDPRLDASDPSMRTGGRFCFLERSAEELQADAFLLNRFQSCYDALIQALESSGGQLRQFIVDDKGTVCIGTFGLRGSAAMDSAAAALEAAKHVLDGLAPLELHASIGITSGQAYCGLVGSFIRHEYAVMGPSTNLSARLMCRAPARGVLCDANTVSRDRTHKFHFVAEMQAKGYAQPVMAYEPDFTARDEDVDDMDQKLVTARAQLRGRSARGGALHALQAAAQEVTDVLNSSQTHHSATQKMLTLMKTDFFICDVVPSLAATCSVSSVSAHKLFGRHEELAAILGFLFVNDPQRWQRIDTSLPAKMVTVCGACGCGKTALMTALERKLQHLVRTDLAVNLVIVRNRSTSVQHDLPFLAWQVLLHRLLLAAHKSTGGAAASHAPVSEHTAGFSKFSSFSNVIDGVWCSMPQELQGQKDDLLAILSLAQTPELWASAPPELRSQEKLQACAALIVTLVKVVTGSVQSFFLLFIGDFQTWDRWSQQVLRSLWEGASGLGIVAEFDTTESVLANFSSSMDSAVVAAARGGAGESPSEATTKFFKRYLADQTRFRLLALKPLARDATSALARAHLPALTDEEAEHIYLSSTGLPLYVHQLTEALSKQKVAGAGVGAETRLVRPNASVMAEVAPTNVASRRIEEVIYYRLDQLQLQSQLMLKAAAVALSCGRNCDLELLLFMLADCPALAHSQPTSPAVSPKRKPTVRALRPGEPTPSRGSLRATLLDLLRGEAFLAVLGRPNDAAPALLDRGALTLDQLTGAAFAFAVPLEQSTIYGMIGDEQKEFFHERVALFLGRPRSTEHAAEEAWHWARARCWSQALSAYVFAARSWRDVGDEPRCAESLRAALLIFRHLEQEVGTVDLPTACLKAADPMVRFLFFQTPEHLHVLEQNAALVAAMRAAAEVFDPDSQAVADAVDLHLLLAQSLLLGWESFGEVLRSLTTALLLCVATAWRASGAATDTPDCRRGSKFHAVEVATTLPGRRALGQLHCLRLLSLCALASRFVAPDAAFCVSHSLACEIARAAQVGCEADASLVTALALQLRAGAVLGLVQAGRLSKAQELANEVNAAYDPQAHSSLARQHVGLDLIPYALAVLGQALVVGKDPVSGMHWRRRAAWLLDALPHGHSAAMTAVALLGSVRTAQEARVLDDALLTRLDCLGDAPTRLVRLWVQVRDEPPERLASVARQELLRAVCGCDLGARRQDVELFMELHGLAPERMYVETACAVWGLADEAQVEALEQRLRLVLQTLLRGALQDYTSSLAKAGNLLHSLAAVAATQRAAPGASAASVFVAVKERTDPALLALLEQLLRRECSLGALMLAQCVNTLPLHDSIQERYAEALVQAREQVQAALCSEQALDLFRELAQDVGLAELTLPDI